MTTIRRLCVPDQPAPVSHYCHVVSAGPLIWISGTVGIEKDGTVPEDVVEQFRVAIKSMDSCLRAAGGDPSHVVKVTVYLTDVEDRGRINPVRKEYFGDHLPASTLVEVSGLVHPDLKVEIDAQAYIS